MISSNSDANYIPVLTVIEYFRGEICDLALKGKQEKIIFRPSSMINEQIYNKYVRSAACEILKRGSEHDCKMRQ